DRDGRHWNRFGWEYAIRGGPIRPSTSTTIRIVAKMLQMALRPLERRGLNGAAYTAVFVKGGGDP
ncbi:MAG: hypothetical protein ACXVRA_01820, partial [Gaiellaceae bacterium]